MMKYKEKHVSSDSARPVIDPSYQSCIFEEHSGDALFELNRVILHLGRLVDCCPSMADADIEGLYGVDLPNMLCSLISIRDGEFGDYVNWDAIADAIRKN